MPDLHFQVESAAVLPFAAVPSLRFRLRVEARGGEAIRSVALATQIRIAAHQRSYTADETVALAELFGPASDGSFSTLKSVLWTQTLVLVPSFTGSAVVEMPVPCTYDFEIWSAKYFHLLGDGEIPLEFLFSGTLFYEGSAGLRVAQIPWEKEARFRMPVQLWKEMMAHYFPNSAWLRLPRDVFDRLYQYRVRHGLPTWEAALDRLLPAEG